MKTIFHQVLIKSTLEVVYKAVIAREGLSDWWLMDCVIKPERGFINEFRNRGFVVNKMKRMK